MIAVGGRDRLHTRLWCTLVLAAALGSALMLPACNTEGPYSRSAYGRTSHRPAGYSSHSSSAGFGDYGSDDPIVAIVVVGLFAIPLIIEGIDELVDWLW